MHATATETPGALFCQPQWRSLSGYLCYPHPTQFKTSFTVQNYCQGADASNDALIPNPLSLWLHIPDCWSCCTQCGSIQDSERRRACIESYLDLLYQEMSLHSRHYDSDRLVRQVCLAGDVASLLTVEQIKELLSMVSQYFHLDVAAGIEVRLIVQSGMVSVFKLEKLTEIGINHFYIMVNDASSLQALKNDANSETRGNTANRIMALEGLSKLKHSAKISIDCSHLLAAQKQEDILELIKIILEYQPDYLILQKLKAGVFSAIAHDLDQYIEQTTALPPLLLATLRLFSERNYIYIGPYQFALADTILAYQLKQDSLCYSLWGYSVYSDCDTVGMGLGAISQLGDDTYAQNHCLLASYQQSVSQQQIPVMSGVSLDVEQQVRLKVMESILCEHQINFDDLSYYYSFDCHQYFERELQQLQPFVKNNMLKIDRHKLHINEVGLFFLEWIARVFSNYSQEVQYHKPLDEKGFSSILSSKEISWGER